MAARSSFGRSLYVRERENMKFLPAPEFKIDVVDGGERGASERDREIERERERVRLRFNNFQHSLRAE